MKFSWPSGEAVDYQSEVTVESRAAPGVSFRVRRMSFARRVELLLRVRDLAKRVEYEAAGGDLGGRIDAAAAAVEIERLYVLWGLAGVTGLSIDGEPATPELVCERGQDALCAEIAAAVRAECGLTERERKN